MQCSLSCGTQKPWFLKLNAVHDLYMAFEMMQTVEKKPLRLTRWMTTLYPGRWFSPFETFNVIHSKDGKKNPSVLRSSSIRLWIHTVGFASPERFKCSRPL